MSLSLRLVAMLVALWFLMDSSADASRFGEYDRDREFHE